MKDSVGGLPNQPSARGTAFRAAFLADTGSRYARNLAVLQLEVAAQIRVRHHRAWYFLADISGQGDNEGPSRKAGVAVRQEERAVLA